MTEVPEHLLKRAQAARDKAKTEAPADTGGDAGEAAPAADSRIPAHLLERSKAAKAKKAGGEQTAASTDVAATGGTAVATAPPPGPPTAAGPGGHTQRLLTVVKSGSIQDVKAKPMDKVHTWPHLLIIEFGAAAGDRLPADLPWVVNALLQDLANFNQTPNLSKAPWYFLGLQELLTMFHPMVAGVTIPGMGIFLLILAPYIDKNPSNKPEFRKFAISLMTVHLMFWAVLTIIGSFFRGPGFNFTLPWRDGIFFEF
ncbi:MAG: menaquinol-cytochrome c reductase cytochrome b subunit [Microthrixaceae bacterium]